MTLGACYLKHRFLKEEITHDYNIPILPIKNKTQNTNHSVCVCVYLLERF